MPWLDIFTQLSIRLSFMIIFFSMISRLEFVRNTLYTYTERFISKLYFALFFVACGVIDVFCGSFLPTRIVNNSNCIIISAGIICGPLTGAFTGLCVAASYFLFFTSEHILPLCSLAIIEGLSAGIISQWIHKQKYMFLDGGMLGFIICSLHLLFLDLFAYNILPPPFVLEDIIFPLLFTITAGTACFTSVVYDLRERQSLLEIVGAKAALEIANSAVTALQNGLNKISAQEVVNVIINKAETFDFVAVTSLTEVLGLDSQRTETAFVQFLHKDVMRLVQSDFTAPVNNMDVIRSYFLVPIHNDKRLDGYFCTGHILDSKISPWEKAVANGIGQLISNQLSYHTSREKLKLLDQAEIKILQSQINPHFLFNALNTISYYCSAEPGIAKNLINDLANYYRRNLADTSSFISIRNELQHVGAYIHLEQARFGERLRVEYIENAEITFYVPPLILQPLVENAVKHGLCHKISGGKITIHISQKEHYFKIAVIDDGIGISKERLAEIFDDTSRKKSIGLVNVNKRLIALYGEKYGLKIISRENKGTIAIIKIPIEKVGEGYD